MKTYLCLLGILVGCVDAPHESYHHQKLSCDPTLSCIPSTSDPVPSDGEIGPCPCSSINASSTITLQIPIFTPGVKILNNIAFFNDFQSQISVPIGTHITAVRVTAIDKPGIKFSVGLREADAIGNNFIFGAGSESSGNGTLQIISSNLIDEIVSSSIIYGCDAFVTFGSGQIYVHSCEIDIH